MNVLEQVTVGWQALIRAASDLGRGALWAPLLVLGAVQFAVVGLIWWFAHPALSWFMAPLLVRLAGPEALHYPNVFRLLPELYGRMDVALGAVVGSVAVGAATVRFGARYRGASDSSGRAFAVAGRRAVTLIAVNLPFNLLVVALSQGVGLAMGSNPALQQAAYGTVLLGSVLLQSFFFYVTALVVLEDRGVLSALTSLPRTWARGFWAALVVGLVLLLPLLPIHYLSSLSPLLVDRGRPELVGWMVLIQVALSLVLWFLLAASSSLLYLSLCAEAPQREDA